MAQQIKLIFFFFVFTNPVLQSSQEADLSKNKIGKTILGKKLTYVLIILGMKIRILTGILKSIFTSVFGQ